MTLYELTSTVLLPFRAEIEAGGVGGTLPGDGWPTLFLISYRDTFDLVPQEPGRYVVPVRTCTFVHIRTSFPFNGTANELQMRRIRALTTENVGSMGNYLHDLDLRKVVPNSGEERGVAITIAGKTYPTLKEASEAFAVSPKTVREWIKRGVIPPPPTINQGLRKIDYFPSDYLRKARAELRKHQKARGGDG